MDASIIAPGHAAWDEFASRLEGPEGCNFTEEIEGNPDSVTWRCGGGMDKTYATAILTSMAEKDPRIDVQASLAHYDEHGGHCDCEILFNVDR